jgi:hypothetical protein
VQYPAPSMRYVTVLASVKAHMSLRRSAMTHTCSPSDQMKT